MLAALVERAELREDGMHLSFRVALPIAGGDNGADASGVVLSRFIPMQMKRRGVELRLVLEGHAARASKADPALLKALARAHGWFDDLVCGRAASLAEIAARAKVTAGYVRRLLRLAFLAPTIVEVITEGRHPVELTAQRLPTRTALPPGLGSAESGARHQLRGAIRKAASRSDQGRTALTCVGSASSQNLFVNLRTGPSRAAIVGAAVCPPQGRRGPPGSPSIRVHRTDQSAAVQNPPSDAQARGPRSTRIPVAACRARASRRRRDRARARRAPGRFPCSRS